MQDLIYKECVGTNCILSTLSKQVTLQREVQSWHINHVTWFMSYETILHLVSMQIAILYWKFQFEITYWTERCSSICFNWVAMLLVVSDKPFIHPGVHFIHKVIYSLKLRWSFKYSNTRWNKPFERKNQLFDRTRPERPRILQKTHPRDSK